MNNQLMIGEFYSQQDTKRFKFKKLDCLKGQKVHAIALGHKDFIATCENYKKEKNVFKIQQGGESQNQQQIAQQYHANQIIYKQNFEMILHNSQQVYLKGHKRPGLLGKGSLSKINNFQQVFKNQKQTIVKITSGNNHSLLLLQNGDVYVWGDGINGQLGLKRQKIATKPTFNSFFENIKKIQQFDNKENQIQNQKKKSQYQKYLDILKDKEDKEIIIDIHAAGDHSFAISNKNRIFGWGSNIYGQLGFKTPKKVQTPFQIFSEKQIIQLATCETHTFIITQDYELFVTGTNIYGQLGIPNTLKQFGFKKVEFQQKDIKIIKIQTTLNYSIALDNQNQIYFWGKNQYSNIINNQPTLIDLKKNNIPKVESIFVTNKFFLLYCPIQFHDIEPRNIIYNSNLKCKIKGYGLGKFSPVQKIKFEVLNLNLYNEQQLSNDQQNNDSEDSFDLGESKMFNNNVDFKNTKSKNAIKVPESELTFNEDVLEFTIKKYDVLFNNWQSFVLRLWVNLDELNWIDTGINLEVYDDQKIIVQDYNPKNFCLDDQQNLQIQFQNLANLTPNSLKFSQIGFIIDNKEIKVKCEIKDQIATCQIPQIQEKGITKCYLKFYPNGFQNVINEKIYINIYQITNATIQPYIRTMDGDLKHIVNANGLFDSDIKQIQFKYEDKLVQQDLLLEDNQYYFNTNNLEIFDGKDQEETLEQQDIEISISLCGQYWTQIGFLKHSKIQINRVLLSDQKGKKESKEDYKLRIFQKQQFEAIPQDLNPKAQEKFIKDLQKKKDDNEKLFKTQPLINNQYVEIEGQNFLCEENLQVKLEYIKNEELVYEKIVEGFIKNSQNFVFEIPQILEENFEVYNLKISFTQNEFQYHNVEDSVKIVIDQQNLDEPNLSKDRAKYIKTIPKQLNQKKQKIIF